MVKPRETIAEGIIREAAESTAREIDQRRIVAAQRDRERVAALTQKVTKLEAEIADLHTFRNAIRHLEANPLAPFKIEARERGRRHARAHEATAMIVLSDLHLEEIVDPASVNGLNEYNLEIAAKRMDRLAVGVVWLLELTRAENGYAITELFAPCLGDVTTNYLRAEDMLGNGLTPMEAIVFAQIQLVRFYKTILVRCPWLERVFVPFVPGNHDRLAFSAKTPFRKRTGMSSAPVLAHGLAMELRDEPRFVLELSPGEHHYTEIYGHTIRGMHGDRFNYQGGVGGIFIPARKHVAALNKIRHAHQTIFGHWHTSKLDDDWMSNGSLIGLNEYSLAKGLDPEPPAQMFALFDRDRGRRFATPVQVSDKEGWS